MKEFKIGKSTFYQQNTTSEENWKYIKEKVKMILGSIILAFIFYIVMLVFSILQMEV